jgi:heat-inducible transcriptional repressor
LIRNIKERFDRVIEEVISSYVATGCPVSSEYIAANSGLGLKPASIRLIMKDLERRGYLAKPHTSAGRIPTLRGYRYYVNFLMPVMDLSPGEKTAIKNLEEKILSEAEADQFILKMAGILSEVTHLVGVALAPSFEKEFFERIEMIPIGGTRLMVVISLKCGFVETIHLTLDKLITKTRAEQTSRFITERLYGMTISDIKRSIGKRLERGYKGDGNLLEVILANSNRIFSFPQRETIHFSGVSKMLTIPDLDNSYKPLEIIDIFEKKSEIAEVLRNYIGAGTDMVIRIGEGEPWTEPPLSLVGAPWRYGDSTGFIGVVGPTRVCYPHISAIVKYAANLTTSHYS